MEDDARVFPERKSSPSSFLPLSIPGGKADSDGIHDDSMLLRHGGVARKQIYCVVVHFETCKLRWKPNRKREAQAHDWSFYLTPTAKLLPEARIRMKSRTARSRRGIDRRSSRTTRKRGREAFCFPPPSRDNEVVHEVIRYVAWMTFIHESVPTIEPGIRFV